MKARFNERNGGMVYDILNNPIYTGDSHNLRRILVDGRIKRIPIDKRVLVKNTHTPIISKKTYALAHKDDALFTSQRGKYPFDKLNKFFIDEKGHCITGQKQKHPKFQCGRLCIYRMNDLIAAYSAGCIIGKSKSRLPTPAQCRKHYETCGEKSQTF